MAEETQKPGSAESKNPFSFLPKFELKLPFFNPQKKADSAVSEQTTTTAVVVDIENENGNQTRSIARFPNTRPTQTTTPLEAEFEESSGTTHNPLIIWQVYALGGFIILKWVWARWQERKERAKKASNDDDQSAEEYQSPTDDDE